MSWNPQTFLIAQPSGPSEREGYVFRGLGLHLVRHASPKGRRAPEWTVTHLGSGHAVCRIRASKEDVFPIATGIAMLGDWEFSGLHGYKNLDPGLRERFIALFQANPKQLFHNRSLTRSNDEIARQVAQARAALHPVP